MKPLLTSIKNVGQPYVDEPIKVNPLPISRLEGAIAGAFGGSIDRQKAPIVVSYQRIRLRWVKPDGNGGMIRR
jgi:hypothetical protein